VGKFAHDVDSVAAVEVHVSRHLPRADQDHVHSSAAAERASQLYGPLEGCAVRINVADDPAKSGLAL